MPIAAHRQRRRPDRTAEIEGEDLSAGISAELQGHQRQQNGFAGARWADDQGMADVADMQGKPETISDITIRDSWFEAEKENVIDGVNIHIEA